ncbi:protein EI24 homolog [Zingiber officinale]|uniref:protein EI24 homolog n=1 Tax=Zingiber officinale TaxID=94328 RepID=UPI001C4D0EB7|nr:protein EI24 homolog [Zingiber officinale]
MASSLAMHATVFPWLAGFEEACSLRRVASFCSRSRILLIRTGQCFLLNGLIFLGSLFILKPVVIPILLWILPDQYEQFNAEHLYYHKAVMPFYALLRSILIELVYIFWFYPLYIFSFVLRTLWYNDIAKHAFEVLKSKESTTQAYGKNELTESQSTSTTEIPGGGLKVCVLQLASRFIPSFC